MTTPHTTLHAPQTKHRISIARVVSLAVSLVALALVAAPGASAETCPNEQLRAEDGSLHLPDCRAYEQVSPTEKSGGVGGVLDFGLGQQSESPMQATPFPASEGDSVIYQGEQFYEALNGEVDEYLARRGPDGWQNTNLTPRGFAEEYKAIDASRDLTKVAFSFQPQRNESGYGTVDLESTAGGGLVPLIPQSPHVRPPSDFGTATGEGHPDRIEYLLGSPEYSHAVFAANDALLPTTTLLGKELADDVTNELASNTEGNYIYESYEGSLRLVSVLPDGRAAQGSELGYHYTAGPARVRDVEHAVSDDGSRVFWTAGNSLYVRENGERTTLVAEDAEFLGATPGGERVLYAQAERLYEYSIVSQAHAVVADAGIKPFERQATPGGGILGTGDEGEYVYFVSQASLASSVNVDGEAPQAGEYNMYLWEPDPHQVGQHILVFIAKLAADDDEPRSSAPPSGSTNVADWAQNPDERTSQVASNGKFVAFGAYQALTGGTNAGPQAFVFNAESGLVSCASCDPSGASNAGVYLQPFRVTLGAHEQRYMLSDGALFFTTQAALLPEDTNSVNDVYEWDDGTLRLISPGDRETQAVLADVSETGSDVFFTTAQPLVSQDQDEIPDLYDARVDGGLPALAAASSEAECSSSLACRGTSGAPAPTVVSSATLTANTANGDSSVAPRLAAKPRTRAQLLVAALRRCRTKANNARRRSCEATVRREYGPKQTARKRRQHRSATKKGA